MNVLKFFVLFLFLVASAQAGAVISDVYAVHPVIIAAAKEYPPLLQGGYRIRQIGEEKFVVIGIGKADMYGSFNSVARRAELDAEAQIVLALNPQQITVETTHRRYTENSSNGEAFKKTLRRKFIERAVAAQTPFITSCGVWQQGGKLYCARAVFVGKHELLLNGKGLKECIVDFTGLKPLPQLFRAIEKLPYISHGGTLLLTMPQISYLLTSVIVPEKLPVSRQLIFARNQAYKNMLAFVYGGKLEQQLTLLTENFVSNKEKNISRKKKRMQLCMAVKEKINFIEPVASWKVSGIQSRFFLYAIELSHVRGK